VVGYSRLMEQGEAATLSADASGDPRDEKIAFRGDATREWQSRASA
jgi:hypothetical protein